MTATKNRPEWAATLLRDDMSGALSIEFRVPTEEGGIETVTVAHELSNSVMAKAIRSRTTLLPGTNGAAANFVDTLRKQAGPAIPVTRQSGWKRGRNEDQSSLPLAFVTPAHVIEFGNSRFRWAWPGPKKPGLGSISNTTAPEQADALRPFVTLSHYIPFAIMCGLAAPLRTFAALAEDPVFHLFGRSSIGKTTAARVAASLQGHPDAMASWDQKPRALEEAAAAHNDVLFVLNAAERCSLKERGIILDRVVHMVSEGGSTVRSVGVQADYPNLDWRSVTLSTGNDPGRAMAEAVGRPWEEQDAARFIDIKVPPVPRGGIFDRLDGTGSKKKRASKLIKRLKPVLERHYGAVLRAWVAYLAAMQPNKEVEKLIRRFVRKVGNPAGLEERIARKFGLIYAAGKIANAAGLLGWQADLPLKTVRTLYRRSLTQRQPGSRSEPQRFAKLLADPRNRIDATGRKAVRVTGELPLAVDVEHKGTPAIGIHLETFRRLLGGDHPAVLRWLNRHGVAHAGHGQRSTCQVPIRLKIDGGRTIEKPRLLLLDPDKLDAAFRKEQIAP